MNPTRISKGAHAVHSVRWVVIDTDDWCELELGEHGDHLGQGALR